MKQPTVVFGFQAKTNVSDDYLTRRAFVHTKYTHTTNPFGSEFATQYSHTHLIFKREFDVLTFVPLFNICYPCVGTSAF